MTVGVVDAPATSGRGIYKGVCSNYLAGRRAGDVVHAIVREEMAIPSALIEHVAARILKRLKVQFPNVVHCTVALTKYNPPVNGQLGEAVFVVKG